MHYACYYFITINSYNVYGDYFTDFWLSIISM